jgi:hypothetical protein
MHYDNLFCRNNAKHWTAKDFLFQKKLHRIDKMIFSMGFQGDTIAK